MKNSKVKIIALIMWIIFEIVAVVLWLSKDNIFYLNGKPYEKYMAEAVHMDPIDEIKLGDNEIFVLSDNRKSSMDSRNEAIGVIDSRDCIGRICFK